MNTVNVTKCSVALVAVQFCATSVNTTKPVRSSMKIGTKVIKDISNSEEIKRAASCGDDVSQD